MTVFGRGRTHSIDLIRRLSARHPRLRARVLAAFLAAADRPAAPLVRPACRAEAERCAALRADAALRACRDNALREAVLRGSLLSTRETARETRGRRVVLRLCCPAS